MPAAQLFVLRGGLRLTKAMQAPGHKTDLQGGVACYGHNIAFTIHIGHFGEETGCLRRSPISVVEHGLHFGGLYGGLLVGGPWRKEDRRAC